MTAAVQLPAGPKQHCDTVNALITDVDPAAVLAVVMGDTPAMSRS